MRISAALIVRNEELMLPGCLETLEQLVDEIVLVDTGSHDRTVEIARQHGCTIHHFEWQDDFALARNYSLEKATGDYVLVADADHRVVNPEEGRALLEQFALDHSANTLGMVAILSGVRDGDQTREEISMSPKFFQRGRFVFEGAIHEQLVPVEGKASQAPTGIQFLHSGYEDREALLERIARNRRILLLELEKNPNDEYYLYQLGKADFCKGDFDGAVRAFNRALENMAFTGSALPAGENGRTVSEDMLIDLLTCLAYSYARLERFCEARDLLEHHLALGHPATQWADFPHALGYTCLMLGELPRAREEYTKALQLGPEHELVRGTGGFSSLYHLGLLAEADRDVSAALSHYLQSLQACPDFTPTLSRCVDLVTEYQAALPPEIWEAADLETFTTVYVKRLIQHMGAGEQEKARTLLAASRATAPQLFDACEAALKELDAFIKENGP